MAEIPRGYCMCGCGLPTPLATRNHPERGLRKGEPIRYLSGHYQRTVQRQPQAVPLPLPGATCRIPLSRGLDAIIDAADYALAAQFPWHALKQETTYYAATSTRGTDGRRALLYLHRLLMQPPPGLVVDHANGDGLDCRRSNMRLATKAQNGINRRVQRNSTSGFRGVSWHKSSGTWQARGRHAGRRVYLGYYGDAAQAAHAYDAWARETYGEFARTNFPAPQVAHS